MGSRYLTSSGQLMQYTFPSDVPTAQGATLAYDSTSGALQWAVNGSANVQGTAGQITVTSEPEETFVVGLAADYQLPPTLGSAGQALVTPITGSMCQWATVGGGGGGNTIGTANEIVITTSGSDIQIGLDAAGVVIPGPFTTGGVTMPAAAGALGTVLTMSGAAAASWSAPTAGLTVHGTTGQITATTADDVATLSLPSAMVVPGSLTVGGVALPTSAGAAGTVLTMSGTATAAWTAPVTGSTIQGTTEQITATTADGVTTLSLPDTVVAPGNFVIGGVNLASGGGTTGQVLAISAVTSKAEWITVGGGGGTVSGTTNQIDVVTTAGNSVVSIAASPQISGSVIAAGFEQTTTGDNVVAYVPPEDLYISLNLAGDTTGTITGKVSAKYTRIFGRSFLDIDFSTLVNDLGTNVVITENGVFFTTSDTYTFGQILYSLAIPQITATNAGAQLIGRCTLEVWTTSDPGVGDPLAVQQVSVVLNALNIADKARDANGSLPRGWLKKYGAPQAVAYQIWFAVDDSSLVPVPFVSGYCYRLVANGTGQAPDTSASWISCNWA